MKRLVRWLHLIEDGLIVSVLLLMIVTAVVQILLRNFLETSLVWVEPFLQNGVLWIGLLGAMIASRKDEHIRIDVVSHYLPAGLRRRLAAIVDLFTCLLCALVAWHSGAYLLDSMAYPEKAFLGLPSWTLQVIIPLGFAVIAARYALLFLLDLADRRPLRETQD